MSKEREILKKILMLYREDKSCMGWGTANEIQQLLAQPESLREDLREDLREGLTREEISQGYRDNEDALNAESFWAGVQYAEKMHGVNNEISTT